MNQYWSLIFNTIDADELITYVLLIFQVEKHFGKRKENAAIRTVCSIINNAIVGVVKVSILHQMIYSKRAILSFIFNKYRHIKSYV